MKYLKSYSNVLNESIGAGSVVIISGPKDSKGLRKLYATHITGYAEVKPGIFMLFLSDEMYRIVKGQEGFKKVRIGFTGNEQLRKTVGFNLGAYGKPSVIRNNNKTPYHWITLKHVSIDSALRAVESMLLNDQPEYILESLDPIQQQAYIDFYHEVVEDTISTLFKGEKKIDVLDYFISKDPFDSALDGIEDSEFSVETDWEISATVLLRNPKYTKFKELLEIGSSISVDFQLHSEISGTQWYDHGSYYEAPEGDITIDETTTTISEIYADGDQHQYSETLKAVVDSVNAELEFMSDYQISDMIHKNLANQILLKSKK